MSNDEGKITLQTGKGVISLTGVPPLCDCGDCEYCNQEPLTLKFIDANEKRGLIPSETATALRNLLNTGLSMAKDEITSFSGEYRFLSNFWLIPIVYDGAHYPSVEHAYQAAKTIIMPDRIKFQDENMTPGQAKRAGRKVTLRVDWSHMKKYIMLDLIRIKFRWPTLRLKLQQTYNKHLIEGNNWGDHYWGVCKGSGYNMLGKILMQVRKEVT